MEIIDGDITTAIIKTATAGNRGTHPARGSDYLCRIYAHGPLRTRLRLLCDGARQNGLGGRLLYQHRCLPSVRPLHGKTIAADVGTTGTASAIYSTGTGSRTWRSWPRNMLLGSP